MLDQKTREPAATLPESAPSRWQFGIIAVLALAVIGLGIWGWSERDRAAEVSDDLAAAETGLAAAQREVAGLQADVSAMQSRVVTLETELATPDEIVVVGGGELTERQQEMVDLVTGPFIEAWRAADGEAVAAFVTPDGIQYDIEGGEVLRTSDGTLQRFAARWAGINLRPGMLVHDHRVVVVLTLGGIDVGSVIDFTRSGELLIESIAMYNSALAPNR